MDHVKTPMYPVYEDQVKIKAEGVREAAEEFAASVAAGDPDTLFAEVWLHRYADRLEGLT